jgi:hypothetical protein
MKTKYGSVDDELLQKYIERLVNKVFKLLPLKQENNPTLVEYHKSLMLELNGANSLVLALQEDANFMCLICSLESLLFVDDFPVYRRKVLECINICKKLVK